MTANKADAGDFLRVFVTLLVYVVLGPLIGMAAAAVVIVPLAMAAFGRGMAGGFAPLLLGNPWLPYYYGLVPAVLAGVVLVVRQARSGPPRIAFVILVGALAGAIGAVFNGGRFTANNPVQIAIYTGASLVAALACHLIAGQLRRFIR